MNKNDYESHTSEKGLPQLGNTQRGYLRQVAMWSYRFGGRIALLLLVASGSVIFVACSGNNNKELPETPRPIPKTAPVKTPSPTLESLSNLKPQLNDDGVTEEVNPPASSYNTPTPRPDNIEISLEGAPATLDKKLTVSIGEDVIEIKGADQYFKIKFDNGKIEEIIDNSGNILYSSENDIDKLTSPDWMNIWLIIENTIVAKNTLNAGDAYNQYVLDTFPETYIELVDAYVTPDSQSLVLPIEALEKVNPDYFEFYLSLPNEIASQVKYVTIPSIPITNENDADNKSTYPQVYFHDMDGTVINYEIPTPTPTKENIQNAVNPNILELAIDKNPYLEYVQDPIVVDSGEIDLPWTTDKEDYRIVLVYPGYLSVDGRKITFNPDFTMRLNAEGFPDQNGDIVLDSKQAFLYNLMLYYYLLDNPNADVTFVDWFNSRIDDDTYKLDRIMRDINTGEHSVHSINPLNIEKYVITIGQYNPNAIDDGWFDYLGGLQGDMSSNPKGDIVHFYGTVGYGTTRAVKNDPNFGLGDITGNFFGIPETMFSLSPESYTNPNLLRNQGPETVTPFGKLRLIASSVPRMYSSGVSFKDGLNMSTDESLQVMNKALEGKTVETYLTIK